MTFPGTGADDAVIVINDLTHEYRNGVKALDNINLTVNRGEFIAIIGKNGSGKTTLAKHFNGLLKPTTQEGRVRLRGADGSSFLTGDRPLYKLADTIGYVFQNPDRQIFHDSCAEELEYGLKNLGVPEADWDARVAETLQLVGLEGMEDVNPVHLSRGERQRLAIASTLVMEPELAVVDEPTTGQDPDEARMILEFLDRFHQKGKTVVIISHDMALVTSFATRVIAMQEGHVLVDGTPHEVFSRPDVLEGTNVRPPQAAVLASRLGYSNVLTVAEAVDALTPEGLRLAGKAEG
jgi:energy-coupling factor transport system ATP-binding protein